MGASAAVHAHALFGLVANVLDARSAPMGDHLGVDIEAINGWSAYFDVLAVAENQDTAKLHRRAGLGGEPVDQDPVAWGHAVLLPAADDDSRRRTIGLGHGERLYQGQASYLIWIEVTNTIASTSTA